MAVYDRNFGIYQGQRTPAWSRFLILPRYAYQEVFQSRPFVAFLALCALVPFAGLLIIYLHHNISALSFLKLPLEQLREVLPINARFFRRGLEMQGGLCFLLALVVGPALISPDLRNNGLPLYLSRPFTRAEYVLGKVSVLAILMSAITWIPGLLLFLFQSYLEGAGWMGNNLAIAFAIFVGSWIWIAVLSLLSLAVSAWVKWKPVARISLLILYYVPWGFAQVLNVTQHTWWGFLMTLWPTITTVWTSLFGLPLEEADYGGNPMPVFAAWLALGGICLISLWLLSRRIRAYEVVR
ncbi:MAG: type transport system permease protein [Acidobacteriota bacterium]|jgi:ABC-2 type transport system permease protein|nr:type transport system permease protein [Acidobacteriota bacterium]